MNQNGNVKSLSDRVDSINKWVAELCIPEVWTYMKMTREELHKLSPIDCIEIANVLRGQVIWIQLKYNKINSCIKSLEYDLNYLIAPKLKDYDKYTKFEEKKFLAIRENSVLEKLSSDINELSQKKEALEFLGQRIENLSSSLLELKRAKYDKIQSNG